MFDEATDFEAKKTAAETLEYFGRANIMPIITTNNTYLSRINASAAYARGASGDGETVVVLDTGLYSNHIEFASSDKVMRAEEDTTMNTHGTSSSSAAVGNKDGIGMHGVAYGAKLHFFTLPDIPPPPSAGDLYIPILIESIGCPRPACRYTDQQLANAFSLGVRDGKGAVVNISLGLRGAISTYDVTQLRERLPLTAAALAQATVVDPADKKIVVWAAGNAASGTLPDLTKPRHDSPEFLAGLGVAFPELRSHVLAVVALDQDGIIATYSNHCGIAKSFCLAAPGSGILLATGELVTGEPSRTSYNTRNGTSFAAPLVSGSFALLRQYFRDADGSYQLGNTELVNRLLATANREGIYVDSDIYGYGLLDLNAATAPVGTLMTGMSTDPNSRPFAGSGIALSATAFGSSLQNALAQVKVTAFDSLDAPFTQSAAAWVTQPVQQHGGLSGQAYRQQHELSLAASPYQKNGTTLSLGFNGDDISDVRFSFADGWWFSYGDHGGRALGLYEQPSAKHPNYLPNLSTTSQSRQSEYTAASAQHFSDPLAFAAPYLSLVRHGPGIGWSHQRTGGGRFGFALTHGAAQFDGRQNPGGERGLGALLDLTTNSGLSLQVGAVRESNGFLGARPQGALGQAQGATTFIGANGAWALGNDWRLLTSAYLGRTRTQVDDSSWLRNISTILSSTFSIGTVRASTWRHGDWFGLRLSQPLRVENGRLKLRLPVGRTKYGEVIQAEHQINLTPPGRNLQAEATYQMPISGGVLRTSMGAEHQPQHDRANEIRPFMRLSFERLF